MWRAASVQAGQGERAGAQVRPLTQEHLTSEQLTWVLVPGQGLGQVP